MSIDLPAETERVDLVRRGRWLEYFTIVCNLLEGIISVGAGLLAGSIALVGFGFDSFIESASGGALLWRLHLDQPERREQAEKFALQLVGCLRCITALPFCEDPPKLKMHPGYAAGRN